eukprot:3427206-Pleurochrysis_carterae.AAC.2
MQRRLVAAKREAEQLVEGGRRRALHCVRPGHHLVTVNDEVRAHRPTTLTADAANLQPELCPRRLSGKERTVATAVATAAMLRVAGQGSHRVLLFGHEWRNRARVAPAAVAALSERAG